MSSPAFVFDAAAAAKLDKLARQQNQLNKFMIIDTTKEDGKLARIEAKLLELGFDKDLFVVCDAKSSTYKLVDYGLVFLIGKTRTIAMFEGSVLSNFEPVNIEYGGVVSQSVEHAFQMLKGAFINVEAESDLVKELMSFIPRTVEPTYTIKIARAMPMDDAITAKWRNINVDVLETLVVEKMKVVQSRIDELKQIVEACGVAWDKIEFWECNKHDDHYGVKMDLEKALKVDESGLYVSPDDAAAYSYAPARNHMGRILGIALQNKTSAITEENKELIKKIDDVCCRIMNPERAAAEKAAEETEVQEPPVKAARSLSGRIPSK